MSNVYNPTKLLIRNRMTIIVRRCLITIFGKADHIWIF